MRMAADPVFATVADTETALVYPEHTARKVYVPALLTFNPAKVKVKAASLVCSSVHCKTAPLEAIKAR